MISTSPTPPPPPVMEPLLEVRVGLDTSGDNLQNYRDELRQTELEAQKKRLVDSFYNEVSGTYKAGSTIASSGSTLAV